MAGPKICPHCEQEMDEDLAELYVCSECWNEFDDSDLERAREERRESRLEEAQKNGEEIDEDEVDDDL